MPLEGHVAEVRIDLQKEILYLQLTRRRSLPSQKLDVVVKTFADAEGCAAHTRDFWTQHVRHVPLDAYANITAGGPDLRSFGWE